MGETDTTSSLEELAKYLYSFILTLNSLDRCTDCEKTTLWRLRWSTA